MKNLDPTSFPYSAVKTFSVATHHFRGIILNFGINLWWGTSDSMKLSKWDFVDKGSHPLKKKLLIYGHFPKEALTPPPLVLDTNGVTFVSAKLGKRKNPKFP